MKTTLRTKEGSGTTVYLKSRLYLPFYFGEHCIFTRSCHYLPFYFGEHCIFEKSSLFTILFWGVLYISEKNKMSLTWIMFPLHFLKCSFSCFVTTTYCKYCQPVRVPEQVCGTKLNQ